MRRSVAVRGLLFMAAVVGGAGCFGQQLKPRLDALAAHIDKAREHGAKQCAPRELALAEAHLMRTRDELNLGHYVEGRQHLAISEKHAKAAYDKSPPERCAKPVDTDGDGIPDATDKCPQIPEDKDGFDDADGCPDPDNDGDGVADVNDSCPNHAEDKDGFEDEDGCPDIDNDNDGVLDAKDRCPLVPEDHDGYLDEDGCPDEDNDSDNIPDLRDKCPDEPEDYDGDQDDDGCPDTYKLVTVTKSKIELKQTIFFATAKTKILPRSFPLLNEVAQALTDQPGIKVRIEGHTDSRGSYAYNQRLSDGRANSVRAYLISRGIAPERMEAIGYGESRPIADNRTHSGRAKNRRVDFFITAR